MRPVLYDVCDTIRPVLYDLCDTFQAYDPWTVLVTHVEHGPLRVACVCVRTT